MSMLLTKEQNDQVNKDVKEILDYMDQEWIRFCDHMIKISKSDYNREGWIKAKTKKYAI